MSNTLSGEIESVLKAPISEETIRVGAIIYTPPEIVPATIQTSHDLGVVQSEEDIDEVVESVRTFLESWFEEDNEHQS